MSVSKELCRVLDLQDPHLAFAEAKKKLADTYMFVDGHISRVLSFDEKTNTMHFLSYKNPRVRKEVVGEIKSLEVFLPETGLYQVPSGNLVYVRKIPKRQWLRSYHGSFYHLSFIGAAPEQVDGFIQVATLPKKDIAVLNNGDIYYHSTLVGRVKDSKSIICYNPIYRQELLDWSKNASI